MRKGITISIILVSLGMSLIMFCGCKYNNTKSEVKNTKTEVKNSNYIDWKIEPFMDENGKPHQHVGTIEATSYINDDYYGGLRFAYAKGEIMLFLIVLKDKNLNIVQQTGDNKISKVSILLQNGDIITSDLPAIAVQTDVKKLINEMCNGGDIVVSATPKYGDSYMFTINTDNWAKAVAEFIIKYDIEI